MGLLYILGIIAFCGLCRAYVLLQLYCWNRWDMKPEEDRNYVTVVKPETSETDLETPESVTLKEWYI